MERKVTEATLGLELIIGCALMFLAGIFTIRDLMIIGSTITLTAMIAPYLAVALVNLLERRKKGK